jgi:hypothetical protein
LVSFTGDEEKDSGGVAQTLSFLEKRALFKRLELVMVLDLTEERFRTRHFTIENCFVGKALKAALMASPGFVKKAAPDEAWKYREYGLDCFSFCLPCRLLGADMHARAGVAIRGDSAAGYMKAFVGLVRAIADDLFHKLV